MMHADTLAALLRYSGPLESLRIGLSSIGSTDDDIPREALPIALAQVGGTLRHFAIKAPTKESDVDCRGLLDECLAVLPQLEVLEFAEQADLFPIPIASSKILPHLPPKLRVLPGRGIVSFSTSRVLSLLDAPESIPVLETLDLVWAEEEKEGAWKERHKERIEEACEEFGIQCRVEKGDEGLVFGDVL